MARLDIAQRQLPQDGRIQLAVRGQEIDFRVATIPTLHGETVVLRVLDRSAVAFDWEALGFSATVVEQFTAALKLPNGIVLVSGPHRQRQDHHTLHRAADAQLGRTQGRHDRGPDRIPARRHHAEPGQAGHRPDLCQPAAVQSASQPRRHHGGGDPRPGHRADRGPGGPDRPPRGLHRAHQIPPRRRSPACATWGWKTTC